MSPTVQRLEKSLYRYGEFKFWQRNLFPSGSNRMIQKFYSIQSKQAPIKQVFTVSKISTLKECNTPWIMFVYQLAWPQLGTQLSQNSAWAKATPAFMFRSVCVYVCMSDKASVPFLKIIFRPI